MNLQEQFDAAVANSKTFSEKPSNDTLLQLYSLYKQATIGNNTQPEPENPFDFVAKAKYNAWAALNGTTLEDAQQQYITLVNNLQG